MNGNLYKTTFDESNSQHPDIIRKLQAKNWQNAKHQFNCIPSKVKWLITKYIKNQKYFILAEFKVVVSG